MTFKHGLSGTPEYRSWYAMKNRCYNPKSHSYKNYGARGITVCDRWRNDLSAFIEDMGARPSKRHTLERCDNEGPYAPANCMWATHKAQAMNRRSNKTIKYQGVTYLICQLADRFKISQKLLRIRYFKYGWDIQKCLINEDFRKYNKKHIDHGTKTEIQI